MSAAISGATEECISEDDREWLQPVFQVIQQTQQKVAETKTAYEQAMGGHQQAVGAYNYVLSRLQDKYTLTPKDDIDTETGVITRNP